MPTPFRDTPVKDLHPNRLVIQIQPEEEISLRFGAKVPGAVMSVGPVHTYFDYVRYFGQSQNSGHERLLHDCLIGDATLFQRADMVNPVGA
jgi:glucose-6-phosphate 1-dehydrogenase